MKIGERVEKIIFKVIDEKNIELGLEMEKSINTSIIGPESQLDSLGIFSFVLDIEKEIENEFDAEITLINDDFFNNESDHMQNIKKLKLFLTQKLSNI
ncbi:hypothetical protein OAN38_04895 [Candidatus Marinimicrobia bacterium]|jgi:hypothetical protein|nr:hypothetical protein [Candidatus Neomarinimicrobiota bacterium]